MVMMLFVVGEGGGIARREGSLWIVVDRSCFSSEVLGLLLLWFDCAAGLGCLFSSEQRAVFIRYLILMRKGEVVNSVGIYLR